MGQGTIFSVVLVLSIVLASTNTGFSSTNGKSLHPSKSPSGTEIIYLDENGNVIGNKTLILPRGLDLKFDHNGKPSTSSPSTEAPSVSSTTDRTIPLVKKTKSDAGSTARIPGPTRSRKSRISTTTSQPILTSTSATTIITKTSKSSSLPSSVPTKSFVSQLKIENPLQWKVEQKRLNTVNTANISKSASKSSAGSDIVSSERVGKKIKSSDKSDVFISSRRKVDVDKITKGASSNQELASPDVIPVDGEIKSIGVKTTITTSFKFSKTANLTAVKNSKNPAGNETNRKAASSGSSSATKDSKKTVSSSISRSTAANQTKETESRKISQIDPLKHLPFDLDKYKFKSGVPINITKGNYKITLFGTPPPKEKNENVSTTLPPQIKVISNASTTAAPKTSSASIPKNVTTPKPKPKSVRWPLNRRRKVSTARRYLLRTRNPLPSRRTPRPMRPTKSSRRSAWNYRTRTPPSYTLRRNVFVKMRTVPTRPPTTRPTTTEIVYTRGPSIKDEFLTADYIKSSGVFRIDDGVEWNNSLADKNSKEFKTLALDLKVMLQEVFKSSVWASVFKRVDIDGFYKGSVVCDFDVIFKRAIANRIKPIHLTKILKDYINREGGQLGIYTVNQTSVQFDAFKDLVVEGSSKPKTEKDPSVLPQWAIAAIVISIASLIFVVLFSSVAYCNKTPFNKKKQSDKFFDDSGDPEKPPIEGYDNLAAFDSAYDLEEWDVPVKQSKKTGKGKGKQKRKDRYYDSWKTEWSGYKEHSRPAISHF